MTPPQVLLVDTDPGLLKTLQPLLEADNHYIVHLAGSAPQALEALAALREIDAVVTALAMHGVDGLELLQEVRHRWPDLPVILMTAVGSAECAVEATRRGAFSCLSKPIVANVLLARLHEAIQARRTGRRRQSRDRLDAERFDALVGDSLVLQHLREAIGQVADLDSPLLLVGETGTGKELVARLAHRAGHRARFPFLSVSCAAAPGDLLEIELFGREMAANGRSSERLGRLEQAQGGTVLLDQIGEASHPLQAAILRFLEESLVHPLGGVPARPVDVRLVATTQRDLRDAVDRGTFRSDLYFRLSAFLVEVPPLRTHLEDLPALCAHLLARTARRLGRPPIDIDPAALDALSRYAFPGNVRELENLLEQAIVLGSPSADPAGPVRASDLSSHVRGPQVPFAPHLPLSGGMQRLTELHEHMERELVERALAQWPHLSNSEIAERLGTNRRILELRMKQYGIAKGRFREFLRTFHPEAGPCQAAADRSAR